ncbi:MAG TPA: hypothetical protein VHN80_10900 [Kineosporiaceae bacterium]|nr:hypothetical protein [Kineosporiaceae bacterium]
MAAVQNWVNAFNSRDVAAVHRAMTTTPRVLSLTGEGVYAAPIQAPKSTAS